MAPTSGSQEEDRNPGRTFDCLKQKNMETMTLWRSDLEQRHRTTPAVKLEQFVLSAVEITLRRLLGSIPK